MEQKFDASQLTPEQEGTVFFTKGAVQQPQQKTEAPRDKRMAVAGNVVMIGAIILLVSFYIYGFLHLNSIMSDNPPDVAVGQMLYYARTWGVFLIMIALVGALGLYLVTLMGTREAFEKWVVQQDEVKKKYLEANQETELRLQRLLGQLADAKVTAEQATSVKADLEKKLEAAVHAQTALQFELDQRMEAEKSLTKQTQQLERSKGTLEMNIQLRTAEMQKMQRRNELILNCAGDGICGFDMQGRATLVNPAAARLTGWKIEELVGKTEEDIFFPGRPKGTDQYPNLLKDENGEYLTEQTFFHKDGTSFPVEYVRTPIKENERVVGAVVMFKDITARRLSDDQLTHKAAELARSNSELEQFAFVASHDLQEPLRKIQAFGDRLKVKCDAVQLEEGRDYLDRMQSAAARMQTLINDLLTFSRVISSSQPFVPVELATVTREVLVDLEHRIEKTGAQMQVGKLPIIDADPLQMRQLLQNLIGNALKFQTAGATPLVKIEGKLTTREKLREDGFIPLPPPGPNPDDKFCLLTVQDNGIGFDEQYLDKVFAVFQRLHGRSEYEGTGVGLAVCRRITDRHHGVITARSQPGKGATFLAVLPVRQPKPRIEEE